MTSARAVSALIMFSRLAGQQQGAHQQHGGLSSVQGVVSTAAQA
jgi:hypothetical protein